MKLQLNKNVQFTKLIKAEGRLREFNFRKHLDARHENICSINVADDRGNRIIFEMQKQGTGWKIQPTQLPVWILDKEINFQQYIEDEN